MFLKDWFKEYLRSLKHSQAEEWLDVYFFRVFAFFIIKALYPFPLTPNHYSLMALISGVIGSFCFSQGAWGLGAFFFFLFAVLDCCDGMQARLKKNGTEFGRMIDGLVDYLVNLFTYFGIAIGVYRFYENQMLIAPWILVLIAGVSKAVHSAIYDHYLSEFLSYSEGKFGFAHDELAKLQKRISSEKEWQKKLLLKIYYWYTKSQAGSEKLSPEFEPREYCTKNLQTLKLWGLIGPAVHILVLIMAFITNNPHWLFYYAICFGNVWLLVMKVWQMRVNQLLPRRAQV